MINPRDYDRTNNCNYHPIDIETRYSRRAKKTEYNSPHDRADNAKRDVEQQALALLIGANLSPWAGPRRRFIGAAPHWRRRRSLPPARDHEQVKGAAVVISDTLNCGLET